MFKFQAIFNSYIAVFSLIWELSSFPDLFSQGFINLSWCVIFQIYLGENYGLYFCTLLNILLFFKIVCKFELKSEWTDLRGKFAELLFCYFRHEISWRVDQVPNISWTLACKWGGHLIRTNCIQTNCIRTNCIRTSCIRTSCSSQL